MILTVQQFNRPLTVAAGALAATKLGAQQTDRHRTGDRNRHLGRRCSIEVLAIVSKLEPVQTGPDAVSATYFAENCSILAPPKFQ
jgi:hypothetical protein